MANSNVPVEIQWAQFHLYLANQITSAMRRAVREAEELTEVIDKQNRLLEERKRLREEEELGF